jgi:polysaccharide biosynthesis protein VpsM
MRLLRAPGSWVLLALLATLAWADSASAQGLALGPFRVLPSLEFSIEYDDNILLTKDDKLDDIIFHIIPGVSLELPSRKYAIRLGYQADVLRYADNTDLDTVHHQALADARVNFNFGLGLRLTDRFLITDDFAGFPVPELTERVERWENTLDVGADYTVRERYTFDINYRWFMVDYKDDPDFDQFDRDDHTIAGTFFYRVLPKTSVLGEINYNIVRYDEPAVAADRDSNAWRFLVGIKGDLTAKTSVQLRIGWEWRDYDNRQDWDGLVAEGSIIWKYREPSQVRIFGGRANVESTFEGTNYYVSSFGGVEVSHFLSERVILRVRGLGGVNQYPEDPTLGVGSADRTDHFIEAGASVKYQMRRWLAFELGYNFLWLNSNFDEFDYTDNRVKASVIFSY